MELGRQLMKKLNRTFLYDNVHFLAIGLIILIFSLKYWWCLFFLVPYLAFVYYKTDVFYFLIIIILLCLISYLQYLPISMKNEFYGLVIDLDSYSVEVLTSQGIVKLFGKHNLVLGDYVLFKVSDYIESSTVFDYQQYLFNQGIKKCFQLEKAQVINNYFVIKKLQSSLEGHLQVTHPLTSSYLITLFLGDNVLDRVFNNQLQNLGISHLLAISGLHITIIINILIKFLDCV